MTAGWSLYHRDQTNSLDSRRVGDPTKNVAIQNVADVVKVGQGGKDGVCSETGVK